MIREVFFVLSIIQCVLASGQNAKGEFWEKQLPVKKVTHSGYETEIDAPADYVRRELWRQARSIASVEQYGEILQMKVQTDSGYQVLLYSQTISVQEQRSFLSLVSSQQDLEASLRELLKDLKTNILIAYYQDQIGDLEKESAAISRRLMKKSSKDESRRAEQLDRLAELNAKMAEWRSKQQAILGSGSTE